MALHFLAPIKGCIISTHQPLFKAAARHLLPWLSYYPQYSSDAAVAAQASHAMLAGPPTSQMKWHNEEGEGLDATTTFLKEALDVLEIDPGAQKSIVNPDRELTVELAVPMDNGQIELFSAYRVQHNNALGPFKGGLVFHPDVTIESMRNLASLNTWKFALLGVPFGGAKGGIAVDSKTLSLREQEKLTRKYVMAMKEILGPYQDIPAPDINTDERHMAWIFDQYSKARGFAPAAVTGKPVWLHGSYLRESANGRAVAMAAREFLKHHLQSRVKGTTFVIQGFGKLGAWTAEMLEDAGGKIIGVSSSETAVYNENGLDIKALRRHVASGKYLAEFSGGSGVPNDESFLETPCDVLIPAAVPGTITKTVAERAQCKAIIEAANSPTTPEADRILKGRGIPILPDIYTNGGGVVVSFFEWSQNLQNFQWDEEEINRKLDRYMVDAYQAMHDTYMQHHGRLSFRTAAYMVACERVERSLSRRGYA